MATKILVIEDETMWSKLVQKILEEKGYQVSVSKNADDGMRKLAESAPDLLIVDVNLEGVTGLQICRLVRENPQTASVPILMLTGMKTEGDKVKGLESGADDYVVKPFGTQELAARVAALLRRAKPQAAPGRVLKGGAVRVDLDRHEVVLETSPVELRPKEFDLLVLFLEKKGRILTKEFIAEALWGRDYEVTSQSILQQVKNLRAKLGPHAELIETIEKRGYRFRDDA